MSRIGPVDYSRAEGRRRELLEAVNGLLGATPNMTTTMARSSVLDGWLPYCLSAHTYLGANVAKLDADELELARHFRSSDPKSAAILAFAEAVVRTKGGVGDSDIQAAREAGLTDAELGDVVGHVAVNVFDQLLQPRVRRRRRLPARRAAPARDRRLNATRALPRTTLRPGSASVSKGDR